MIWRSRTRAFGSRNRRHEAERLAFLGAFRLSHGVGGWAGRRDEGLPAACGVPSNGTVCAGRAIMDRPTHIPGVSDPFQGIDAPAGLGCDMNGILPLSLWEVTMLSFFVYRVGSIRGVTKVGFWVRAEERHRCRIPNSGSGACASAPCP